MLLEDHLEDMEEGKNLQSTLLALMETIPFRLNIVLLDCAVRWTLNQR